MHCEAIGVLLLKRGDHLCVMIRRPILNQNDVPGKMLEQLSEKLDVGVPFEFPCSFGIPQNM